jgi:predicted aminopeptidase
MYEDQYPDTAEKRRAGMAALRRNALAGKLRALASGQCPNSKGRMRVLTQAECDALRADCAHIQQVQRAKGEE